MPCPSAVLFYTVPEKEIRAGRPNPICPNPPQGHIPDMTSRDHWAERLHCRNCDTTGEAEFSQACGHAYASGDQDVSVDRVPIGFKVVRSEYGSSFYCARCEASVDQQMSLPGNSPAGISI
jgi:hypothetical protein